MSYTQQVKESISNIIADMAKRPGDYSLHPDKDFSRSRKLSFPVLLHLMLSMETGSIRDELLKYFAFTLKQNLPDSQKSAHFSYQVF